MKRKRRTNAGRAPEVGWGGTTPTEETWASSDKLRPIYRVLPRIFPRYGTDRGLGGGGTGGAQRKVDLRSKQHGVICSLVTRSKAISLLAFCTLFTPTISFSLHANPVREVP